MYKQIAFSIIAAIFMFGCSSTAQKKFTINELNHASDAAVIEVISSHQMLGKTNCHEINQEVEKTRKKNEAEGTLGGNKIFSYTLGAQTLLLNSMPVDMQFRRILRLQAAFKQVKQLCNDDPELMYADALKTALANS